MWLGVASPSLRGCARVSGEFSGDVPASQESTAGSYRRVQHAATVYRSNKQRATARNERMGAVLGSPAH